jgi:uncharacterized YigZ family protein
MEDGYKIVYQGGTGEIVEKKSRFIASLKAITTEAEALSFLGEKKKQHWDASHNCYAYLIGNSNQLQRCSDDGEPQGTAGRPMLEMLMKENIHDAIVIVTRYFGGTLLGTGGLVRAYQKAVLAAVAASVIVEKQHGIILEIKTNYNGLGKIQHILAEAQIAIRDTQYTELVVLQALVPNEQRGRIGKALIEGTNGSVQLKDGEEVGFAMVADQPLIL